MASSPKSRLEVLLRTGLDLYAMNRFDEAARCWREARLLDAADPRADEYLAALAAEGHEDAPAAPDEAPAPAVEPVERRDPAPAALRAVVEELEDGADVGLADDPTLDKARFVTLLREKRYDEALDVLYRMRKVAPDNPSVSRGIQLLKQKLHAAHLERLGHLDRIPTRAAAAEARLAERRPTPTESLVLELVDGIATAGDILESSRAGRFATARALARLLERGVLSLDAADAPEAPPGPPLALVPEPEPPPAAEETGPTYDDLFREATQAYVRRDLDRALELFRACRDQRPDDRRVAHNIERLEARMRNQ